jgi:uncharacterized damage-inducible protein DinB
MPTADYARLMARYGAWQNKSLIMAAEELDEDARRLDRGTFFGSISGTLNHLLWGDRIWMSRFAGTRVPTMPTIAESHRETEMWGDYMFARGKMDAQIIDWAGKLNDGWFAADLTWWSGAAGREVSKPKGMLVTHFFNHGTHHRGQVHAMLTAAGVKPGDTDLFLMP